MKYISGKSRRRIAKRQRTKKRFFKGGYMVVSDFKTIAPATWDKIMALSGTSESRRAGPYLTTSCSATSWAASGVEFDSSGGGGTSRRARALVRP